MTSSHKQDSEYTIDEKVLLERQDSLPFPKNWVGKDSLEVRYTKVNTWKKQGQYGRITIRTLGTSCKWCRTR